MLYGRTGSKLADDPEYDELYAAAEGGLARPLADYFTHNFWVAGSGTVSPRYLRAPRTPPGARGPLIGSR